MKTKTVLKILIIPGINNKGYFKWKNPVFEKQIHFSALNICMGIFLNEQLFQYYVAWRRTACGSLAPSTVTPWSLNSFWYLWQSGQVLLENEIHISNLVRRRKHEDGCVDCGVQNSEWTNTSKWHQALWKLHTPLHAMWILCLSSSLYDLDFRMKYKICSKKRTVEHRVTLQVGPRVTWQFFIQVYSKKAEWKEKVYL